NRRREARHADLMARGQADLRLRQAMLATLRPEEFVSQNAPASTSADTATSEGKHPACPTTL
ncbi:MAG: hypothetical protein KIT83_17345, partial [Bryobacterales bacterium]|nr:hypothetical protein [Bryobacterales bacterium]